MHCRSQSPHRCSRILTTEIRSTRRTWVRETSNVRLRPFGTPPTDLTIDASRTYPERKCCLCNCSLDHVPHALAIYTESNKSHCTPLTPFETPLPRSRYDRHLPPHHSGFHLHADPVVSLVRPQFHWAHTRSKINLVPTWSVRHQENLVRS